MNRRYLPAAVTCLTVLGLLTGNVATAAAGTLSAAPVRAATHQPAPIRTVTLITGDVVQVTDAGGGRQAAEVTRPRAAQGGARSETIGDDLYVFPDEVMPYLAADGWTGGCST